MKETVESLIEKQEKRQLEIFEEIQKLLEVSKILARKISATEKPPQDFDVILDRVSERAKETSRWCRTIKYWQKEIEELQRSKSLVELIYQSW